MERPVKSASKKLAPNKLAPLKLACLNIDWKENYGKEYSKLINTLSRISTKLESVKHYTNYHYNQVEPKRQTVRPQFE